MHSDFHRERTSTTTLKMMSNIANMTKHFSLGSGRVFVRTEERFPLQNRDLRNGIGQSVRELLNREMGFICPLYRRGTERYLSDPYQPTAKVSS